MNLSSILETNCGITRNHFLVYRAKVPKIKECSETTYKKEKINFVKKM